MRTCMCRQARTRYREGVKLNTINVQAMLRRIVVNESPRLVYIGIMNDEGVRYTLIRHRNEQHGQKRACKFDRNIFVAMVEQSRDRVARLNIMSDVSWIHVLRLSLALFALKEIAFDFRSNRTLFPRFVQIHVFRLYTYLYLLQYYAKEREVHLQDAVARRRTQTQRFRLLSVVHLALRLFIAFAQRNYVLYQYVSHVLRLASEKRDDILFRKHCYPTPVSRSMSGACVYRRVLYYIFIPVSRAFAGYLRQIVRLSGFAVPIFSKEAAHRRAFSSLARSLARRGENIVLYDVAYDALPLAK